MVTGVFVEHAESDSVLEDLSTRRQTIQDMKQIFVSNDKDEGHGKVPWGNVDVTSFIEKLGDHRIRGFFKKCGLHIDEDNVVSLFEVLDFDGSGTVDAEEFIHGCAQLAGTVRSIDLARLRHDVRKMLGAFLTMAQHHERRHQQMKSLVQQILQLVGGDKRASTILQEAGFRPTEMGASMGMSQSFQSMQAAFRA